MLDKFIGRSKELKALIDRFDSDKAELIVIYGRRRIGKTRLILESIKDRNGLYYLCDKRNEFIQLTELSRRIGEHFDDRVVSGEGLSNWESLFDFVANMSGESRFIMVIDEFPYLTVSNRSIPSLFQKGWDLYLQNTHVKLVILGSSISMMEKEVLDYESPLFGRRTSQILVGKLPFSEARDFFPGVGLDKKLEYYSIVGGTPAYLNQFDAGIGLLKNISESILRTDSYLFDEVEFILREELREPRQYFTILGLIASGRTRINEISTGSGLDRNVVSRYLSIMGELGFIRREVPITERYPKRSRKGIYRIKDNFFRFWFRFVLPNLGRIEMGRGADVLRDFEDNRNMFVSREFEKICIEALWKMASRDMLGYIPDRIGGWWDRDEEIDLVALSDKEKRITFGECKWTKRKMGDRDLIGLMGKAEGVKWSKDTRMEDYILFSRSGFTKNLENDHPENVRLIGLKELDVILR